MTSTSLNRDLVKRHNAILLGKRENRKRYATNLVITWIPFVVSLVGLLTPRLPSTVTLVSVFGALIGLIVIYGGLTSYATKVVHPLDPVETAFEQIYESLLLLEPVKDNLGKTGALDDLSSDEISVLEHVYGNFKSAVKALDSSDALSIFLKEPSDIWEYAYDNIRNRMLPAVKRNDVPPTMLEKLARILSAPNIEDLGEFAFDLEEKYKEEKTPEISIAKSLAKIWATRPGRIGLSVLVGYGIIIVASLVFATAKREDFNTFTTDNPGIILLGGAALTGAILAFVRK